MLLHYITLNYTIFWVCSKGLWVGAQNHAQGHGKESSYFHNFFCNSLSSFRKIQLLLEQDNNESKVIFETSFEKKHVAKQLF